MKTTDPGYEESLWMTGVFYSYLDFCCGCAFLAFWIPVFQGDDNKALGKDKTSLANNITISKNDNILIVAD